MVSFNSFQIVRAYKRLSMERRLMFYINLFGSFLYDNKISFGCMFDAKENTEMNNRNNK